MVSKNMLFAMAAAMTLDLTNASSAVSRSLQRRHVSLAEPRPYKGTGYGPTNPLDTDGGNYPCKAPGGDGSKLEIDGAPTEVVIGEPATVSFSGHAVHGGGSCQFGLTEGFAPTKNSVFKVIQSIEGGCPKANQVGNLEGGQQPDKFSFTVPADFAPGDYTFGWIWINRVGGSPEIYMNCAPLKVKAGKGSTRRSKERRQGTHLGERQTPAYPDFFLANLGSVTGECSTNEALKQQVPIKYPHPGSNVIHPEGTSKLFAQPCDGNPHNKGAIDYDDGSPDLDVHSCDIELGHFDRFFDSRSLKLDHHDRDLDLCHLGYDADQRALDLCSYKAVHDDDHDHHDYHLHHRSRQRQPNPCQAGADLTPPGSCTDGHLLCVETVMFSICTGGRWIKPQGLADNTVCALEGESVGLKLTVLW
ncbi:hypothetical protein GGTG_02563 [Gaeumannomyces tritici R3-111a-1]|uniref:Endoglucanase n=1 Tax=Gaeumannomyces tritici (strain R3-111a-1) TaxID=644352 RepID=J3NMQ7_GAET3|nr:hypothetical protein GGTG_02563 [Gaeumannomyces tritici R3-111a-1]EJT82590.1 hypothetical protein GGTG_02563 [Gaeumannomyces tritici R3-111a-1]